MGSTAERCAGGWARAIVGTLLVLIVVMAVGAALAGPQAPAASAGTFKAAAQSVIVKEFIVYDDQVDDAVDREPAIDGDVVVWTRGSSAVLGHDISSGTDFTVADDAGANSFQPAISGDTVVWITYTTLYGLAAADISDPQDPTPIALGVTPGGKYRPDVDGEIIVWEDYRTSAPGTWGPPDVYGYNLATNTEFPIATGAQWQGYPSISGTRVTWTEANSDGYGEIHAYDLATRQHSVLVAIDDATATNQRLDGDRLTWVDQRYGGPGFDVFARDLTSGVETEVATGPGEQSLCDIHGDTVIYVDVQSSPYDATLYGYDLGGGGRFTLATLPSTGYRPAVSGDALSDIAVWDDERNEGGTPGGDEDIYGARIGRFSVTRTPLQDWVPALDFDLAVTPPPALFSANEMRFSADEVVWSDWEPIGPKAYELPAGADGERAIYVQLRSWPSDPVLMSSPARLSVGLDRVRPVPVAPRAASARRGSYVTLKYLVKDAQPCAGTATMTLAVKTLRGRTVKRVTLGTRVTRKLYGYRFRCRLARGSYRFYVYATDSAGNRQLKAASNRLKVK